MTPENFKVSWSRNWGPDQLLCSVRFLARKISGSSGRIKRVGPCVPQSPGPLGNWDVQGSKVPIHTAQELQAAKERFPQPSKHPPCATYKHFWPRSVVAFTLLLIHSSCLPGFGCTLSWQQQQDEGGGLSQMSVCQRSRAGNEVSIWLELRKLESQQLGEKSKQDYFKEQSRLGTKLWP